MAMPLSKGRLCADRLIAWLAPFCHRIEVAGSIRRERQEVGDVDLVAIPRRIVETDMFGTQTGSRNLAAEEILARVTRDGWSVTKSGQDHISWMAKSIQVDIWFTHPWAWGTVLLCRTGSAQHNIWLAEKAKSKGGHWNPHHGLRLPGQTVVISETEDSIYHALGIIPIAPHARERGRLPA